MHNFWELLASPTALVISALPMLADAAIKRAIVIGTAALLVLLLRRRSAATRHAVWAGAVAAQLALPVLATLLPAWRVPLLPAVSRYLSEASAAHVIMQEPAGMGSDDALTIVSSRVAAARARAAHRAHASRSAHAGGYAVAGSAAPDVIVAGGVRGGVAGGVSVGIGEATVEPQWVGELEPGRAATLLRVIAVVWLLGCLAIFGRFVAGTLAVWRLSRSSERVEDGPWLAMAQRIANALGVKRPLTLLQSGRFGIPVTWGVVYPVVLLPADAGDWQEQRRQYVLVHEMAHVKRVDAFTQLLAQLTLALFWFNPLVWLAVHRMRVEREHACDDYVLRQGTSASTYASDLLDMVRARWREESTAQTAFAALAMARPGELEARMSAILDPDQDRRALSNRPALTASLGALAMLLPLAAFSPFAPREPVELESRPAVAVAVGRLMAEPREFAALTEQLEGAAVALRAQEALAADVAELAKGARELHAAASSFATTEPASESCDAVRLRRRGSSASTSIHTDDDPKDGPRFQFLSSSGGRCLEVKLSGTVDFTSDERAVRGVSRGGELYLRERFADVDRELTVTRGEDATPEYDYAVNGRHTEFDDSGRAWLAELIPEILRESGLNVRQRVARIRKDDGVRGVLAEIERTSSTGAKGAAYNALIDQGELSESELDAVVAQARRDLSSSDGEMRAVLEQIGRSARGRLSRRATENVEAAVGQMSSDGEKRAVLQQYGSAGDRETLLMAMRQAREMSSDGEKAALLRTLAPRYLSTDEEALRNAYFSVCNSFSSDGERASALSAALPFLRVSPGVALGIIESARHMSSDGEKAEVLVALARQRALASSAIREAFMRATRSISSDGEYRRVMEVALQQ